MSTTLLYILSRVNPSLDMDDRENNTSMPNKHPVLGGRSQIRRSVQAAVRNVFLGLIAIAAVVAMHLGFPLLVMQFVSTLAPTLGGIGLFLLAVIAVVFLPGVGTVLILGGIDDVFLQDSEFTVRSWPWIFAIPSALVVIILISAPLWGDLAPSIYDAVRAVRPVGLNLASWIIAGVAVIMVITEFGSGAIRDFSAEHRRGKPGDSDASRERARAPVLNPRQRQTTNEIVLDQLKDELAYDWQRPPSVSFGDVGGLDDVKDAITRRVITPIQSETDAYTRFRVSAPTGILLYGPPGTGKSYLARAIAGELQAPYIELSHADLTSMWINESSAMVRQLFEEAELFEFSVIFIDEIDGLIRDRGASGHSEDTKVVSEFLARLGEERTNYLIIAATNRRDQLDSAILRPGRFGEQFEIGLPDVTEREEIFKVQLRGRRPSITNEEYEDLAALSEGLTAADISAIVEHAALRAAESDADNIFYHDLAESFD